MQYLYVSLYSVLRSVAAQLKVYLRMNAHAKIRLTSLLRKQTAKFNPRVEMWLYDIVTILLFQKSFYVCSIDISSNGID